MKSFSSIGWAAKNGVLGLKVSTLAIISTAAVTSVIVVNEVHKSQKEKNAPVQVIPPAQISTGQSNFESSYDNVLFSPVVSSMIKKNNQEKETAVITVEKRKAIKLDEAAISRYLSNSSIDQKSEPTSSVIKEFENQPTNTEYQFSQEDLAYFAKYGLEREIVPASFKGNNIDWDNYIEEHLKYPKTAIKNEVEGVVIVNFEVEIDGSVSNAFISKSISKALDKEALRLVNEFPDWNSKSINDQSVSSLMTIPIKFDLQ